MTRPAAPPLAAYAQLHFLVLIWSFTAILGVLVSISPVALVAYRTLLAAVMLFAILYFRKTPFGLPSGEMLRLFATGALLALHWILFFAAARISTVSVCLAGMSTASLWTSLLEPAFNRKPVKLRDVLFGLIAIAGLYIIFKFEFNHFAGLVTSLAAAFLASLFVVLNSHLVKRYNAVVITYYEMTGAAIFSVLFLIGYQLSPWSAGEVLLPTLSDGCYILILTGVCTVYAYSLAANLMKQFSAFMMNLTVNLEPVYGIGLAILVFGERERMTNGFYLGTLVILAAVLLYPLFLKLEARARS